MHRRLARTSVQRSVSKFTKSRSDILGKDSEPALSAKQMSQLQTLFDTSHVHGVLAPVTKYGKSQLVEKTNDHKGQWGEGSDMQAGATPTPETHV